MAPATAPTAPKYSTSRGAVNVGPGQRLAFTAGKGYYSAPAPATTKPVTLVHPDGNVTTHGSMTDAQLAAQQVSAAFDPVAHQLTAAATARGKSVQDAINSYTGTLGDLMGGYGPAAKAAYTGAEVGQGAVDAALGASLHGQGAQAQSDLAAKLAALGTDPGTVARLTGNLAGTVQGAEGAQAAHGSNALTALIAHGANAQDYGAKQPGLAGLFGLGATKQAQGAISTDLQTKLAALTGQEPGAILTALHNIATGRASAAKTAFDEEMAKEHLKISQQNADTSSTNASTSQTRLGLEVGHWKDLSNQAWARIGIANAGLQLRAKALDKKQANGGFTPSQLNTFTSTAYSIAHDSLNGYTDKAGAIIAPRSYSEAMDWMLRSNVPPAIAAKELNSVFPVTKQPVNQSLTDAHNQTTGTIPNLEPLARKYGLDPTAVMAVAAQEGLGGGVGDSGTSFGPFQLHAGGALPAAVWQQGADFARQWAWSPAGVEYALRVMSHSAKGLTGAAAINAIVRNFERPAKPDPEVAGALSYYNGK